VCSATGDCAIVFVLAKADSAHNIMTTSTIPSFWWRETPPGQIGETMMAFLLMIVGANRCDGIFSSMKDGHRLPA